MQTVKRDPELNAELHQYAYGTGFGGHDLPDDLVVARSPWSILLSYVIDQPIRSENREWNFGIISTVVPIISPSLCWSSPYRCRRRC